jgi:hypothetical protein
MVKSGKGLEKWANGASWVGTFKDDKRVGEGVETLWNGAKIYGTWVDGELPKEGKIVNLDGSEYEGELTSVGSSHGQGTMTYPDGATYSGA